MIPQHKHTISFGQRPPRNPISSLHPQENISVRSDPMMHPQHTPRVRPESGSIHPRRTISVRPPDKPSSDKQLNLKRSSLDQRDHVLEFLSSLPETGLTVSLPSQVNLLQERPLLVFDQGSIGSCTANSAGSLYMYILTKLAGSAITPSRLFLYWNSRSLINTTMQDSGCTLRHTMQALARFGVCRESIWAYNRSFLFKKPTTTCYSEGATRQALSYASIPTDLFQMKSALNAGQPFVFGVLVYSSFMLSTVALTGNVPTPDASRERFLGGHAMCAVGYDDTRQVFIVKNSWGTGWGDRGNAYIPYSYMSNPSLCFDIWTLYTVEVPSSGTNPRRLVRGSS